VKNATNILVLALCSFIVCASVRADVLPQRQWDDVKAALKRGAYREALQSLDIILLSVSPDDPRAQLYRTLCERRLASPQQFAALTPLQLNTLKQQLRAEEGAQRRASAQQQTLERQVRREQERWDQELETLHRQAQREQKVKAQREQAQALERVRAERAAARTRAQELAVAQQEAIAQVPSPAEHPPAPVSPVTQEPSPSPASAPSVPAPAPSVELSKVIVPTTPSAPAEEAPVAPSEERGPLPAGAVQINARQMSVSPERKIAIAEGNVEVIFQNAVLTADHMTLFTDTNDVYAEGRVRLEEGTQVFRGEMVHYNFKTKKGRFLQGTVASPPWYQHGRSVEHIAEGVYEVTPGYITSCDMEPPHFRFYGRRAIVFAGDKVARAQNVALFVEQVPFLYLPWISFSERQSPFFIVPGKRKPWGPFALMGYRYELPGPANQKGTVKLDWRQNFHWGMGIDHQFDSKELGAGLLKLYYNRDPNGLEPLASLPKGADKDRYRILWRHNWHPLPDTTVITDIQKFSDIKFRKEFLFREEFSNDDTPESFISTVTNTPAYTLSTLVRKRVNRFQTQDEALPQVTLDVREQRIGETPLFSKMTFDVANLTHKEANSENDTDVFRVDWFQRLSYAFNWLRPILITPNVGVRQTFYTKDIQNEPSVAPREGQRDLFSGQFSGGVDASLKLFRIFPVTTNALGLDLNLLRHVLTPAISYLYDHPATVPNSLLNFPAAVASTNVITWSLENKLQTRRPDASGKLNSVDLARFVTSLPYTFHGDGNKSGGRIGDWLFDLELYPWSWMRLESDWKVLSHVPDSLESNYSTWNLDLVMVGGKEDAEAKNAPQIQAPMPQAFQTGNEGLSRLLPQGQWYLGLGHRFSQNDKTESVIEYDWRLSPKWQINTFYRFTWKEVAGGTKRFNNMREYQYTLQRDLHDWLANFVYHVDREFGEEIYFTLTLKAYPKLPIQTSTSYHEPKVGSQSSPFSPIRVQ